MTPPKTVKRNEPAEVPMNPLGAVAKVKEAIDIMEDWMKAQRGKGIPMVVYQSRTRTLSQFVKVMIARKDQIDKL